MRRSHKLPQTPSTRDRPIPTSGLPQPLPPSVLVSENRAGQHPGAEPAQTGNTGPENTESPQEPSPRCFTWNTSEPHPPSNSSPVRVGPTERAQPTPTTSPIPTSPRSTTRPEPTEPTARAPDAGPQPSRELTVPRDLRSSSNRAHLESRHRPPRTRHNSLRPPPPHLFHPNFHVTEHQST